MVEQTPDLQAKMQSHEVPYFGDQQTSMRSSLKQHKKSKSKRDTQVQVKLDFDEKYDMFGDPTNLQKKLDCAPEDLLL